MKPDERDRTCYAEIIARNVARYRVAKGWSQSQLEHASGVTIGMIEAKRRVPRISTLEQIASALGVTVLDLMRDDKPCREPALKEFLNSSMADNLTAAEVDFISYWTPPPGRTPTLETYFMLLQVFRSTSQGIPIPVKGNGNIA